MFRSLRLTILLDLLVASLVPLGIAMLLSSLESRRELRKTGEQNVRLLARVTASRLDQLLYDTQRVVQIISTTPDVQTYCAEPTARPGLQSRVQQLLNGAIGERIDYSQIFLIDDRGIGMISTNVRNVGQDLNFREYYQIARTGQLNTSHWLVAKSTGEPGVFFASPVWRDKTVVGVMALKLDGDRVQQIINEVRLGVDGYAILADQDGIVLAHPDRTATLKTFAPLDAQKSKTLNLQARFGVESIGSLGIPALQNAIANPDHPRLTAFALAADEKNAETDWVAGLAQLKGSPWTVIVVQPQKQFAEAAWNVVTRQIEIAAIVAVAGALLSFWRARSLVRPLLSLTKAAKQLASGDFAARAQVFKDDEVGQLARTFNGMVPKLEQQIELQKSLEIAQRVQQSLLPQDTPQLAGLEIASRSRYCDATGGDYFDFAEAVDLPQGQRLIAVGDVTGHGLGAALVMCTARASLRTAAATGGTMGDLLSRVNHCLCQSVIDDMFMTMTVMRIDPDRQELRYACAAHEAIIVCDPETRHVTELTEGSLPLGALPGKQYDEHCCGGLKTGTLLFLGTDGIWEACNDHDEMFTRARLIGLIADNAHRPAVEIGKTIEKELTDFLHGRPIQDDITYVIVKLKQK